MKRIYAIIGIAVVFKLCLVLGLHIFEGEKVYYRRNMYEPTGMMFDGFEIYQYSNEYRESEQYNKLVSEGCTWNKNYIDTIDDVEYYYETESCNLIDQEYMILTNEVGYYSSDTHGLFTLTWYMSVHYNEDVLADDLLALDFVLSRQADFVITDKTIPDDDSQQGFRYIYTYSERYIEENSWCFVDNEIVIYEDDDYEYVYSYKSCPDSTRMEHMLISDGSYSRWYTPIERYIKSNLDIISWEDIEALEIGVKVSK